MTDRYGRTVAAFTVLTMACAPPAPEDAAVRRDANRSPIVIDGMFDDWAGVPAIGDGGTAAGEPRVRRVQTSADGEAIYLRFTVSAPVVLQAHAVATRIVLDVDGSPSTGTDSDGLAGADVTMEFSPLPAGGGTRGGFTARSADGRAGRAHDVGFSGLPTHGSQAFEARIERGMLERFAGVALGRVPRGRIVSDRASGSAAASPVFTWRVPPASPIDVPTNEDPLARADDAAVRVVAWNVADRSIHAQPEAFGRVLRALAPDVLLIDELPAATDDAMLHAFLSRVGPGWRFALGAGGGRQRAAVASRLPLEAAPAFARVDYPDSIRTLLPLATFPQTQRDLRSAPTDGLSTAGAYVDVRGRRVLFVAVDLACCGGEESVEDRFRRIQADAIRGTAAQVASDGGAHTVVIGGDLNLVGSRRPLEILLRGLDPAGGDLAPVYALQLDGRTAATWRHNGPFQPGRLDWILHSPSALAVARAFVFDSRDLGPGALSRYGIEVGDSDITSDHLPVVADFGWLDARR